MPPRSMSGPLSGILLAMLALPPAGTRAEAPEYALTIYHAADAEPLFDGPVDYEPPPGYAIVHERRSNEVGAGRGTLTLNGFPRYLDHAALTVALESGRVLNQRFEAETVRSERLLERSIGRQVSVEQIVGGESRQLAGELLSASVPLALRLQDGSIVSINDYSRIHLPSPPAGVSAVPQLRLGVESERAGTQTITLVYPVAGVAWRADYLAQLRAGRDCRLDFYGHAQIVNRSGHGFAGARLRLIAGERKRAGVAAAALAMRSDAEPELDAPRAESRDAYQYRPDAPVDLPDGSSQQVALIRGQRDVDCTRERLYVGQSLRAHSNRVPITAAGFGRGGERRVRSTLSFPLPRETSAPAGRMRLLVEDHDGTLEFLGEQQVPRTRAGQRLDVTVGEAPDLRGEREVAGFELDPSGLSMSERVTITLQNGSDAAAQVRVREHLYRWSQWQITDPSQPFEQRDGDTIEFLVDVPANGTSEVSYRVGYRWTEHFKS